MTRTRLALLVCLPVLAAAAVWFAWLLQDGSEAEAVNVRVREHREVVLVTTKSAALDSLAARVGFTPAMPNPLPSGTKRLYEVESLVLGEGEAVTPRSFLSYVGGGSSPVDGYLTVIQGAGYWGPDISAWLDANLGPDEVQVKTRDDGRNGGWEYWIIGRKWSIYVASGSPSPPDRRTEQMLLSLIRQVD